MRQDYKVGQSLFDTQPSRDFFYDLAPAIIKSGWADISALTVNNRVISIAFALKFAGVFYYWIPAFDTEFIKYSLSKVHIQNLLKSCFEQYYTEFDFMRGDEEYKFKWTNAIHKSYDMRIYRNNLYFNMDSLISASRNRLKDLYSKHPFVRKLMVKISKSRFLSGKS
jgi:CelD/BcsL family acetyltransferase involved in cellulose biosynthesis